MPDKQYISKITLPNGQTYEIKDQEARDLIAQIAAGSLAFVISTAAGNTPEGIEWTDGNQVIIGTLPASDSDAKGKIYLVPHVKDATTGNVDYYREYVTVNFGSEQSPVYAWEFLGDTDIDLSGLGDMAYADTATGSTSISTVDSATFTDGAVNASGSFTPNGNISVTLAQTGTAATLTKGDYTPQGTINKPDITVTPTTSSYKVGATDGSVTAGTAATFNEGAFTSATFSHTADVWSAPVLTTSVASEVLTIGFSSGSFTEGSFTFYGGAKAADTFTANTPTVVSLPTFTEASVMTGATAALATAPSFTGSTAASVLVTGVSYDKATVSAATFTGTSGTVTVTGTATGSVALSSTSKTISVTVNPD